MGQQVIKHKAAGVAMAVTQNNLFQAPFKGYLTGVFTRGAGLESLQIESNRSVVPTQHLPGRDIAIQTDTLDISYIPVNQPCQSSEIYNCTPQGTGTAKVVIYFFFTRKKMGPWFLWQKSSIDTSTIVAGTAIQRIPEGSELLAMMFIRSPDIEALSFTIGTAGARQDCPGRNIALNTDAEPLTFSLISFFEPAPKNQDIILIALDAGTGGASAVYTAFQLTAQMLALAEAEG